MKELISLGELYSSDFVKPGHASRAEKTELALQYDTATQLVRLTKQVDPSAMYGQYWYRSGINETMKRALKDVVDSTINLSTPKVWLDIACNDGTLLSYVPKDIYRIGIDPADETFLAQSSKHANVIIQDFFSKAVWDQHCSVKADVVTCIAMFYDTDEPNRFLQDIHYVMSDNGVLVLQMSYTPLMLEQMAFDNICHEHLYYYTLTTLQRLLADNGFRVMDCELNAVNGGSFRTYAIKLDADETTFGSQAYRDVCKMRVDSLLELESYRDYNQPEVWEDFSRKLIALRDEVREFILAERAIGKTIWAYGASTKGNTLLQYFGLDATLIDGIAERNPDKVGLQTVGTNIPIYSEEHMRQTKPDYLLILPWHFISEFMERESEYLKGGGKFLVPCPQFCVVGSNPTLIGEKLGFHSKSQ